MNAENEHRGVEAARRMVKGLTAIALLKSRGHPQDHKKAAEIMEAMMPIVETLRQSLNEGAAEFENVPDNIVEFTPKGKPSTPRHL